MKAKRSFAALFAAVLVIALLLGGVLNVPAPATAARDAETEAAENAEKLDELRDFAGKLETLFQSAAQAADSSVVSVMAIRKYPVPVADPSSVDPFGLDERLRRRFFGDRPRRVRERERRVLGSGVILDKEGHILTNNHVVADATELQVKLADGRTFDAELTGSDAKTELAIIKIKGEPDYLPVAKLGDSDKVHVGQWVLAIGDPFGQVHTVSAGIISATGRSGIGAAEYEDWLQTDAAINPGNSGGPLVNLRGEVIGINTFIISKAGGNIGIGFAIPINMFKDIQDDLLAGREIERGFLGIYLKDLTPELADAFDYEGTDGVLIDEVTEGSPAEEAGLKAGDIIIEYDGRGLSTMSELKRRVAATKPGSRAKVKIWRDGKERTVTVKTGDLAKAAQTERGLLGIHVQTLTKEMAQNMGYPDLRGVLVADVDEDSRAARYLSAGDVILEVNKTRVRSVQEYRELMGKAKPQAGVLLRVLNARNGRARFLLLRGEARR